MEGHSVGKVPEVLVRPRLPKAMVRICVWLPESGVEEIIRPFVPESSLLDFYRVVPKSQVVTSKIVGKRVTPREKTQKGSEKNVEQYVFDKGHCTLRCYDESMEDVFITCWRRQGDPFSRECVIVSSPLQDQAILSGEPDLTVNLYQLVFCFLFQLSPKHCKRRHKYPWVGSEPLTACTRVRVTNLLQWLPSLRYRVNRHFMVLRVIVPHACPSG